MTGRLWPAIINLNELVNRSDLTGGDHVLEGGIGASDQEDTSYQQGVVEANAELERGVATLYTYGNRHNPLSHVEAAD